MKIFEIVLSGFDGSTDGTDDHIIWVKAESEEVVLTALDGHNASIQELTLGKNKDLVDFNLPVDKQLLREHCKEVTGRESYKARKLHVSGHEIFLTPNGAQWLIENGVVYGCEDDAHDHDLHLDLEWSVDTHDHYEQFVLAIAGKM